MFTLGLLFIGVVVVLLGSMLKPPRFDPMGIFGLPPVGSTACRPAIVEPRAARRTAMLSRHEHHEAA